MNADVFVITLFLLISSRRISASPNNESDFDSFQFIQLKKFNYHNDIDSDKGSYRFEPLLIFRQAGRTGSDGVSETSKKNKWVQFDPGSRFNNPNFIRDRFKDEIYKPDMPPTWANRHKQPYNPAWMDYCDPYHCNDYHKQACGLNRRNMKFKWFQSACHIQLSNMCANYRGHLQYDIVDTKFCFIYVMYLRTGCPQNCEHDIDPICAVDNKNKAAIFVNRCALEMENCQRNFGYEEIEMSVCEYYFRRGAPIVPTYLSQ